MRTKEGREIAYKVCKETNAQGDITWKLFILKRQLFQVIFCHGHQQYVYFFAALYLPQDGSDESFRSDGVGDPLQALLEGALGQQAACQLWFHFWYKKKYAKYGKKWSWEDILTPYFTPNYWK